MVHSHARSPLTIALAAAAAVNLAIGVWVSLQPARLSDFVQVTEWLRLWMAGFDVYVPGSVVDYPPWALASLAPLGLVPSSWQALFWIAVNVGLAITIAVHLARLTGEPGDLRVRLAVLFLAAAAFRTLNQFSLFALAVALAGATLHWRVAGGLILGIGLMKPQIGGPVLLWVLLNGQFRKSIVALAVPLVITMFFADHIDSTAATVLSEYAKVLGSIYGHEIPFTGHTEVKGLIVPFWPGLPGGLWLSAALAACLVLPALVAILRRGAPLDRTLEVLAFCGVVSLLAFRHLSYDLVLLLPALAAWRTGAFSARATTATERVLFVCMLLWLVGDPGAFGRRAAVHLGPLAGIAVHIDRLLCLLLWAVLSLRLVKDRRGPRAQ